MIHLLHADLGAALLALKFQSLLQLLTPPLLLHQPSLQLLHLPSVLAPLLLDLDQTQNLISPRCLQLTSRIYLDTDISHVDVLSQVSFSPAPQPGSAPFPAPSVWSSGSGPPDCGPASLIAEDWTFFKPVCKQRIDQLKKF